MKHFDDTIVALATPPGTGSIAVIRLSGKDAVKSASNYFESKKKLTDAKTHTVHYGRFVSDAGEVIDDILASVFLAPNSYTGEDTVELSCHGNQLIVEKIIDTLMHDSVRLAEPGEFTKRAYLNGRLDLSQAEAVVEVINARSSASLKGARNQLDGLLSAKVGSLRSQLINTSSLLELELDFAEEDLEFVERTALQEKINEIQSEVEDLLGTYTFGRIIRDGVNVAIVGKPNVGKSSLLNYILKESRAIVSEIPGTTRDIIREEISIDGILFRLYDTAGIRLTDDVIEKEGVERSREAVRSADIVLYILEDEPTERGDLLTELQELSSSDKIVTVANKSDVRTDNNFSADMRTSAVTGEGMQALLHLLKRKAIGSNTYTEKTAIVSNIRHFHSLKKCSACLSVASRSVQKGLSPEYIAVDLRNAEAALDEIIGVVTTDDILNNIFASFCIGK